MRHRIATFSEWLANCKRVMRVQFDKDVGAALGLAGAAFSKRGKADSIPYAETHAWCAAHGASMDELLGLPPAGITAAEAELLALWRALPDWARTTHLEEFRHLAGFTPAARASPDGQGAEAGPAPRRAGTNTGR